METTISGLGPRGAHRSPTWTAGMFQCMRAPSPEIEQKACAGHSCEH